ncbi:WxL domain-containing protein [Enterococcus casseliflavus]|uniref:WxL domain-containing protein n=1 Tax=Enterococcus casseliflavus TaxID=37734 RepID=UPI003D6C312D
MKKTACLLVSLSVLAATVGTLGVNAAEVASYNSNGSVDFIPNTDPSKPVNPENPDPENPVNPIDPTDPDGPNPGTQGPLSIDYASSFDFGVNKISNRNEVYYARAQRYESENDPELKTANYVQVTDNRGSNAGWRLSVKQNGQFKNDNTLNSELTGSVITLIEPSVKSNAIGVTAPTPRETITLDVNGAESIVMTAAAQAGAGTWVNSWGKVETITEKDANDQDIESDVTKAVALSVPGSTPKDAVSYSTTLTWVLSDTPESE